jgi:hypothetical protein
MISYMVFSFFFLYMCTPFLAIREENMRDMVTALFKGSWFILFFTLFSCCTVLFKGSWFILFFTPLENYQHPTLTWLILILGLDKSGVLTPLAIA